MKKVIGICGAISSGKDTAGEHISGKLNIPIFECSRPVIEEVKRRGLELTRKNMMLVGRDLAEGKKGAFPMKLFLDQIKDRGVVTGIRDPENIIYLRKNAKLIFIGVEANSNLRYERAKKRNKLPEAQTLEEFEKHEEYERQNSTMDVLACLKMVDYMIKNNSSLDDFKQEINEILKKEGLD